MCVPGEAVPSEAPEPPTNNSDYPLWPPAAVLSAALAPEASVECSLSRPLHWASQLPNLAKWMWQSKQLSGLYLWQGVKGFQHPDHLIGDVFGCIVGSRLYI